MDNPTLPPPRLDMYAQDLLRQSYQTNPISQDVLNQYGRGMAQQAVQQPEIQNYAPQAQQQVQQPSQRLQPDPKRIDYNSLIEERFNELANEFGGVQHLAENDALEFTRKKAAADIASYYGPPPTSERPLNELERVQLAQQKIALAQAQNPAEKPSELVNQIGKDTSTYLVKMKPMIGQLESAIALAENKDKSINEKLASMKLIGKLMNSVMVGTSDAVSQDEAAVLLAEVNEKFKPSGMWTSEPIFGNDLPQFVSKLKNLRDSVSNEYNNSIDLVSEIDPKISKIFKKKTPYGQTEGQPTGKPAAPQMKKEYYDLATGQWSTNPPAK